MDIDTVLGPRQQFIQGDIACVYGALVAGCRFFAGYPITPATEIAEEMSYKLPQLKGTYLQMEDEIGSISAVIGASWTGKKSMTATSGPGFSLMQENIGYAVMTEPPCVIVDVQRGGPSTGQPTHTSQGDIMQARYGTHGDSEIIAVSPSSVQEALELTIAAFNYSEKYRVPVVVLMEESIGHMREKVTLPDSAEIIDRKLMDTEIDDGTDILPFAVFGHGHRRHVTGLTHKRDGCPSPDDPDVHAELLERLSSKIVSDIDSIFMANEKNMDDATTVIVSYGMTSRPIHAAVDIARGEGKKVGHVSLKTLWPFNYSHFEKIAEKADRIIVAEMNLGMIYHPIREAANGKCKVEKLSILGGKIPQPDEILEVL